MAIWGAVLLAAWIYVSGDVPQPAGVLAPSEPRQVNITERTWERGGVRYTALAQFDAYARVLSTNHYYFDGQADLSPVDLALGWGTMSDSDVLARLKVSQSNRFYFWRARVGEPLRIAMAEISSHSANMHMIPEDDKVKEVLLSVRPGELVSFGGYLVRVEKPGGWTWKTSLSRTDTGAGACEVVWVKDIVRKGKGAD